MFVAQKSHFKYVKSQEALMAILHYSLLLQTKLLISTEY